VRAHDVSRWRGDSRSEIAPAEKLIWLRLWYKRDQNWRCWAYGRIGSRRRPSQSMRVPGRRQSGPDGGFLVLGRHGDKPRPMRVRPVRECKSPESWRDCPPRQQGLLRSTQGYHPCRKCSMLAANRASAPASSFLWPDNSCSTAWRMNAVGGEKPRFSARSRTLPVPKRQETRRASEIVQDSLASRLATGRHSGLSHLRPLLDVSHTAQCRRRGGRVDHAVLG
jgi:hypothetical protein